MLTFLNFIDTFDSKINDSWLKRFHWDKISGRPFGGFIDICNDRWDPRWHICLQILQTCFSFQAIWRMQVKVRQSGVKRKDWGCIKEAWWGFLIYWSIQFFSIRNLISAGTDIEDQSSGKSAREMLGGGFVGRFSWLSYSTYVGRRVGEEGSSEIKGNSCDLHLANFAPQGQTLAEKRMKLIFPISGSRCLTILKSLPSP